MLKTDHARDEAAALEAELGWRHRGRIRSFGLTIREGVLTMDGEANSFHALQLVLRDVLAAKVAADVHNRITVRNAHTI